MPKLYHTCTALLCAFTLSTASADSSVAYNRTYDLSTAPRLSIVTYAIDNLDTAKIGTLSSGLSQLNADVIALNESSKELKSDSFNEYTKEFARLLNSYFTFSENPSGSDCSVGFLSRYPINNVYQIDLPASDSNSVPLLCAEINIPNFESPLLFLNTAFENNEDLEAKIAAVRYINEFVKSEDKQTFPITNKDLKIKVLTGNFNDTANGPALYELSRYFNLVDISDNDEFRSYPAQNPALDVSHILTYRGQKWETDTITVINMSQGLIPWQEFTAHLPLFAKMKLIEQ